MCHLRRLFYLPSLHNVFADCPRLSFSLWFYVQSPSQGTTDSINMGGVKESPVSSPSPATIHRHLSPRPQSLSPTSALTPHLASFQASASPLSFLHPERLSEHRNRMISFPVLKASNRFPFLSEQKPESSSCSKKASGHLAPASPGCFISCVLVHCPSKSMTLALGLFFIYLGLLIWVVVVV